MASVAAVPRPPGPPGPEVGHQHPRMSGAANLRFQDPGLHGAGLDPGLSLHPHHHMAGRPLFYLPAMPPPPFLQYQWPMPFSYNPFGGFPGMGYGMVMPPLPPPYMEPPAYIMPHHQIQPDYYRRFQPPVQLPVQPPTGMSYQNPTQSRRIYPPYAAPRETVNSGVHTVNSGVHTVNSGVHTVNSEVQTVNSEVQTEPAQRLGDGYGESSPFVGSDSGQATASCSPLSSSSRSHKQGCTEMEGNVLTNGNANDDCRHAANVQRPVGTKTVQSHIKASLEAQKGNIEESMAPYRNTHCNMWSVCTPESMIPVCSSSQQEDEVLKERRSSVPDILMSWEGGTPQTTVMRMVDKVLPLTDMELPSRISKMRSKKCVDQSPTKTKTGSALAGTETQDVVNPREDDYDDPFKILKLPFVFKELLSESRQVRDSVGSADCEQLSLNHDDAAQQPPDYEQVDDTETTPRDQIGIPSQLSLCSGPLKRKMNESVWSVESLAPYVPNKEWLMLNSMFETKMITELAEEVAENGRLATQNGHLMVQESKERRRSRMFSNSGLSDGALLFSTPLKPNPTSCENKVNVSELTEAFKQDQSISPSEKDLVSCPRSQNVLTPPTMNVLEDRSSEPEATQCPNQDSCVLIEQQVEGPCSSDREQPCSANCTEKLSPTDQPPDTKPENGDDCGSKQQQLCVPTDNQNMTSTSPSKVDCGTQCDNELQRPKCLCDKVKNLKNSDVRKANNGKTEGNSSNGHMQKNKKCGQWRNKRQEKQQESHGYSSKARTYVADGRS